MSKIRFLLILFDQPLQSYEIPKLRAAIIEKTKRQSDLFHNHVGDTQFVYRYPLIQYKIIDRKPALVCLKEATEDIHYLLKEKDFNFRIGQRHVDLEIEDVRLKFEYIQTWDETFTYNLHHWLALNQEHFAEYKKLEGLVEQLAFLEKLLTAHLRIFLEEMGGNEPQALKVKILQLKEEKYIEYKDVFHLCFTINFSTNLSIPNYVGIGKGVSVGFGSVKKITEIRQDRNQKNKDKYEAHN